jgi:two-component system, OmpR family, response regulator
MSRTIAIVEDEPLIRENYADVLRRQGYEVNAYPARKPAMDAFTQRLPNLALIDIGLGDEVDGGFTLCRDLRALSPTLPIIFLTARDSDFDTVAGLRMGADDYLTKDVSLHHLLARISALFRRSDLLTSPPSSDDIVERDQLRIDMKRFTVTWQGKPVDVTLTEFWTHAQEVSRSRWEIRPHRYGLRYRLSLEVVSLKGFVLGHCEPPVSGGHVLTNAKPPLTSSLSRRRGRGMG